MKILLKKPQYFSLEKVALSHGWIDLYPYEWDGKYLIGAIEYKNRGFDYHIYETSKSVIIKIYNNGEIIDRENILPYFNYSLSLDFPSKKFVDKCHELDRNDLAKMGWQVGGGY